MKSFLFVLFNFFYSLSLWACPGCAGSMDNPKDAYLVYILAGFIILTYIPFYFIYRLIKKHKDSVKLENLNVNN